MASVVESLKKAVQVAKDASQKASDGSSMKKQVRDILDMFTPDPNAKDHQAVAVAHLEYVRNIEYDLLTNQMDFLLEQALQDKQVSLNASVIAQIIIEEVREVKLTIWEADGRVNPADHAHIVMRVTTLRARARTILLAGRATMGKGCELNSLFFDALEDQLIEDVLKGKSEQDKDYNLMAQAAIYAVAELRVQQLAK